MVPDRFGPEESIEMDASLKWGIGAINHIGREFFLVETPQVIKDLPIHCAEMSALMLAVDTWYGQMLDPQSPGVRKSFFQSAEVKMFSDNQAVIHAINHGKARDDFL